MCFHTSQTKKVKQLEKRFNVVLIEEALREIYDTPHYHNNGFDHLNSLIIPQQKNDKLIPAVWGLAPSNLKVSEVKDYYKKQVKYGSGLNARSEKLFDYWLYKKSALTKRCIIPVTGFFEPHYYNNKSYPIHIKRKDESAMGLAGIYTVVENVVTYSILTKSASPLFAKIHNKKKRQPIILSEETENLWLDNKIKETEISNLINEKYNDNYLNAYVVSKDIFNSHINSNIATITNPVEVEGLEF